MSTADAPLAILAVLVAATFIVHRGPWRLYQGVRYWLRLRRRLRGIRADYQPTRPNG